MRQNGHSHPGSVRKGRSAAGHSSKDWGDLLFLEAFDPIDGEKPLIVMRIIYSSTSKSIRSICAIAAAALLFALPVGPEERLPENTAPVEILREHVRYLAADKLTGRGVETPGITLARDYIVETFKKHGLLPGGDRGTYLQAFQVVTGVEIKQPTSLALGHESPLVVEQDWVPLGLSGSGKIEGEIVFVGYGITDEEYGYDDYAGIDVKGKIALVLRYEPPPKNDQSPFRKSPRYSNHSSLRTKARNARDHGAAGMIIVDLSAPEGDAKELMSTRRTLTRGSGALLAAQVKRQIFEERLQPHGLSLAALKDKIDREEKATSMVLPGLRATLQVTLEQITRQTENVVGILPGSDPELKDENVVIGAHYDHLGFGLYGTRDSNSEGQIHHGADDNASGTAAVIYLAERFGQLNPRPSRTIVFVAFSGEELGLYGSRHYVNDPPFPLSSTRAMINLDMVGRLRDNRVTIFGTGTSEDFAPFVAAAARQAGLDIRQSGGVGRSDHISFYNKKIPVLHFFTGTHADYHRPTDTWEKINFTGLVRVADLVLATAEKIAEATVPLNFVSLPQRRPGEDAEERRGYGTYLGTVPDFASTEAGVRLASVHEGSPAARAGMREGDVVIQLAEVKVENLEDLAFALRGKKPGDEVAIVVLRDGKPLTLPTVLGRRG